MSGLYHYSGMALHYLSEDGDYAVYYRRPKPTDKPEQRFNPWRVYRIKWDMGYKHKNIGKYADLKSAVDSINAVKYAVHLFG